MARFRIRTKEGQEITFASHEVFAEFVRSGELSPEDVVYDAETREWSPARTHPVVLQIELEPEEAARAAGAGEPDADFGAASTDDEGLEAIKASAPVEAIDLELALTPEEEAAAFVAKMEAERATERGLQEDVPWLRVENSSSGVAEELGVPRAPRRPPQREPWGRELSPRSEAPAAMPAARKRREPSRGRRYAPLAILGLAAAAAAVYFGPDLLAPAMGGGTEPGTDNAAEPPPPPPAIADTEESLRARARERFLTSTQTALRNLPPVPDIWLRGSYLAAPSEYPRVPEVWQLYLETIRDVRAGDDERYRQAYLRALDEARVEGGARTLRLTSAVTAFQGAGAPRAAHWERVEAVATAALRGHDALVSAEGTIMYQPATGPSLSADPVIEAVGRSPEAQALLNQVLDVILRELHAEDGPGEVRNVREWVWDGFLEAVTS